MGEPATAAVRILSGEREPVRVATTENILLQGLQTIDGVALAVSDRVLVKDQTDARENGIYTASNGRWFRASDASFPRSMGKGVTVLAQEGTANSMLVFRFQTSPSRLGIDDVEIEALVPLAENDFQRQGTSIKRPYLLKVSEVFTVADYGASGDGTDEGLRIQAAVAAAVDENKSLLIPPAETAYGYITSQTLDVDFSSTSRIIDRKRPFLRGDSAGNSIISYTGTGSAIRFKGSDGVGQPYPDGHHALTGMSDLTILGAGINNGSHGIHIENCAYLDFQRLDVENFNYGVYANGFEFSKFTRCNLKRNGYGARAQMGVGGSHPNGITFDSSEISINEYGGLDWTGGASLTLNACSVQYNGYSSALAQTERFGVRVTNAGYQGGVGVAVFGGYFEHNAGIGDFYLRQLATAVPTINGSVYDFFGVSFNRVTSAGISFAPGPHNIFASFQAQGGPQKLSVIGCSFKHFNSYVPNGANKYIKFDDTAAVMSAESYRGIGNYFMSSLEAPALADIA